MEIPFYYSFKEFKENYETDLKKWLEVYTEGEEWDYLTEIGADYSFFCDRERFVIKDKNKKEIDGDLDDFLQKFINACFNFFKTFEAVEDVNYNKSFKELLEEYGYSGVASKLEFNERILRIIVCELIYEDDDGELYFDSVKFPNFTYAVPKIYNFILDRLVELEIETQTPPPDEVEPITLPENIDKIQINGNYQLLAFLFRELIEKGYINAPTHNGKPSHKRTAEMLLRHFEFTNKEEQPTIDNLTNYIKNNTYSMQKQSLFKIPSIKKAND